MPANEVSAGEMPANEMPPEMDEFFQLWWLIAQTKDAILKARERDFTRYGISNDRRAILFIIQNNGGRATPADIARDFFREIHSVTEMLKRMEKDGLVVRHKSTGRSKVEVELTEKGRRIFAETLHSETDKRIFSGLTKREREFLASCLWKLRRHVLQDLGIPEWRVHMPYVPSTDSE